MTQNEALRGTLDIADLHAKRLKYAMNKLKPMIPLSGERFSKLSEDEIPIFELFSSRFAKLQDLMGTKLFGLVLDFSKEPGHFETFLDKLNKLEKIGLVPNSKDWLKLREIRNHLSHEYPENPEISANNFNEAYQMSSLLLKILDNIKLYIKNIESRY